LLIKSGKALRRVGAGEDTCGKNPERNGATASNHDGCAAECHIAATTEHNPFSMTQGGPAYDVIQLPSIALMADYTVRFLLV
jgi:hypothetical protein